MSKHPMCDKVLKHRQELDTIGQFLDWLVDDGISLCEIKYGDEYWPTRRSIEQLLADYFEIDRHELEKEQRMILDDIRKENER